MQMQGSGQIAGADILRGVQEAIQSNDGGRHVVQQLEELSHHAEGSGSVAPALVQQEQERKASHAAAKGRAAEGHGSTADAAIVHSCGQLVQRLVALAPLTVVYGGNTNCLAGKRFIVTGWSDGKHRPVHYTNYD